jgi:hypothetical protein
VGAHPLDAARERASSRPLSQPSILPLTDRQSTRARRRHAPPHHGQLATVGGIADHRGRIIGKTPGIGGRLPTF